MTGAAGLASAAGVAPGSQPALFLGQGNPMHAIQHSPYAAAWRGIGQRLGPDARLAIPTPEHYLPLLYVLGCRLPGDRIAFPVEGIDGGSISMLAVELRGGQ